jgi:hypothetical protein
LHRGERSEIMDAIDKRILRIIQKDACLSISEMATQAGLSQTPCWKRMKRLASNHEAHAALHPPPSSPVHARSAQSANRIRSSIHGTGSCHCRKQMGKLLVQFNDPTACPSFPQSKCASLISETEI